ncbi:hypothetical protein [Myxococcus hansupus]|uniref:hypothetical protein n=1 Tax=Pseudomyxococcus hansupus TaxID=1297742 RepID=UPI000B14EC8D|nr:hypothetical protein [Myxococcus hansupus]
MPFALQKLVEWGHCLESDVAGIGHWLRGSQGFMREDGVLVALQRRLLPNECREVPDYWRIWGGGLDLTLPGDMAGFDVLRWVECNYPLQKRME